MPAESMFLAYDLSKAKAPTSFEERMQDCNRIGRLDRKGSDAIARSRGQLGLLISIATAAGHDDHANCIFVTNNYFLCYYVEMILILALGRTWTASKPEGRPSTQLQDNMMGRPPVHDRSVSAALAAPPPPMCVIRRAARWAVSTLKTEADGGRWEWINIKVKKMDLRFVQGCLGSCVQGAFQLGEQRTGRAIIYPASCFAFIFYSLPFFQLLLLLPSLPLESFFASFGRHTCPLCFPSQPSPSHLLSPSTVGLSVCCWMPIPSPLDAVI